MARTSYTRSNYNDVRSVLDLLDLYSDSSLKQKSAGVHVAPLRHVILIPSPVNQSLLFLVCYPLRYMHDI